jgi:TrmH family RNA methyltransferase
MPIRIVQSKQNARLKELRRALSRPGRETKGLAGVEGMHLLEEALRADMKVPSVFVAQESLESIEQFVEHLGLSEQIEVLVVPRAILDSVLETETPQPVAALVEMPDWTWGHVLRARGAWAPMVVVLAGLQDPGNLGTILRSAEAFGATGVVALPGTVSAWNPKAVRSSAGSIFRVPLLAVTAEECFTCLREAGARILTTTVRGAEPADMMNFTGPVALLIGNEGNGVPEELARQADARITIPCPGAVESLNAAVATSVLLYEACRQRMATAGGSNSLRGSAR